MLPSPLALSRVKRLQATAVVGVAAVVAALTPPVVFAADDLPAAAEVVDVEVGASTVTFTLAAPVDGSGWVPTRSEISYRGSSPLGFDTTHRQTADFPSGCSEDCAVTVSVPRTTVTSRTTMQASVGFRREGIDEPRSVQTTVIASGQHDWAPARPSVVITGPPETDDLLGDVTVAAEATAAPGGAPLKGVRFYVGRRLDTPGFDDYQFDVAPPYQITLHLDATEDWNVRAVAEDVNGVLSLPPTVGTNHRVLNSTRHGSDLVGQSVEVLDDGLGPLVTDRSPRVVVTVDGGAQRRGYKVQVGRLELFDQDGTLLDTVTPVGVTYRWTGTLSTRGASGVGWRTFVVRMHTLAGAFVDLPLRLWRSEGPATPKVSVGGRPVTQQWLTAGTRVVFDSVLVTKASGDAVTSWSVLDPGGAVAAGGTGVCGTTGQLDRCGSARSVRSAWTVPRTADPNIAYRLSFLVGTGGDFPVQLDVPLRVRHAGAVSAPRAKGTVAGRRVLVRGRASLRWDGGSPHRSRASLQYRPKGGKWRTVARVRSNHAGELRARPKLTRTGHIRWVLADAGAKHSGATSRAVKVVVRTQ